MARADFHRHIGDANICAHIADALQPRRRHMHGDARERPDRRPHEEGRGAMTVPSPQLQTLKAEFFRALAHPIRIRLLEVLVARGEMSVQELQRALGSTSRSCRSSSRASAPAASSWGTDPARPSATPSAILS